jgi:hypothetical protein
VGDTHSLVKSLIFEHLPQKPLVYRAYWGTLAFPRYSTGFPLLIHSLPLFYHRFPVCQPYFSLPLTGSHLGRPGCTHDHPQGGFWVLAAVAGPVASVPHRDPEWLVQPACQKYYPVFLTTQDCLGAGKTRHSSALIGCVVLYRVPPLVRHLLGGGTGQTWP